MITNDVDEAVLMADRIVALTPGPKATLGESFDVELERPRDRTTLNFNPEFIELRNTVTKYMVRINEEAKALRKNANLPLPDLMPIDFLSMGKQPRKVRVELEEAAMESTANEDKPELVGAGVENE